MTPFYADLHVHSTASDGVLTPTDLMRHARESGLSVVGLTDHDTVKGVPEALKAATKEGIRLIPGIELSCGWPEAEGSLHVVGLFVNPLSTSLLEMLDNQQRGRYLRAFDILDRLEKIGVDVQPLRERFLADRGQLLGRPHIARYLLDIGLVKETQEAFERFLGRGAPAHVPKPYLLPETGINIIHDAGGLAIIAHPGLTERWDRIWEQIKDFAWDGIEVFYAEHSSEQVERFRALAEERGFLMSGGSDFHGELGRDLNRLGGSGLSREQFTFLDQAAERSPNGLQALCRPDGTTSATPTASVAAREPLARVCC